MLLPRADPALLSDPIRLVRMVKKMVSYCREQIPALLSDPIRLVRMVKKMVS